MSELLKQFDNLMSHLNAEDNDSAKTFRANLQLALEEAADDSLWRDCVTGAGVDNWDGYEYAMEDYHGESEDDE